MQVVQEPINRRDWQPYHVRPGAVDPVDEAGRAPLYAVRPCLVERLAGRDAWAISSSVIGKKLTRVVTTSVRACVAPRMKTPVWTS